MRITTTQLIDVIRGKASSSPVTLEFPDTEVELYGVNREIEVEVAIGYNREAVKIDYEFDGREDFDVELTLSHILEAVIEEGCAGESLGVLLRTLDHEETLKVVHAIARAWGTKGFRPTTPEERQKWYEVYTALGWVGKTAETVVDVEVPETEKALVHAPTSATEPPDVGILVTPEILESHSSVKETVKSILADEDGRLLMIGLLVEAGYAVGKKVS